MSVFILRCEFFTLVDIQIHWAGIWYHVYISRGPAGWGAVVWPPQAAESKGWQNGQQNIVNEKKNVLCTQKILRCW